MSLEKEEKEVIVKNFTYSDSETDEELIEDLDDYDGYDTADEDTENFCDFLNDILSDIADVETLGLKVYKINFYDNKVGKMEDYNCVCDFDKDDKGQPIMPDGGEEFIVPYLSLVRKKKKYLKDCIFETNINFKFTIK